MAPQVLLWDFGDTLVDERWMRRAPSQFPEWPVAWTDAMRVHAGDWDTGKIGEPEIIAALVERTGMDRDAVEQHVGHCCTSIEVHPVAWRVATERRLPQALVTVNPDLFVERLIPALGLQEMFDTIVVSSLEGTSDKVRLCDIALQRLGLDGDRGEALLIDNRRDIVDAWTAVGGATYWYRDDAAFEAALPGLFA